MTNNILESERLLQILDATEELILEKGCNNTTLNDIIKKSNTSKGGIYHYVSSKDELFGLLLQRSIKEINKNFIIETKKMGSGLEEPLQVIAKGLSSFTVGSNSTGEIFLYLLGKIQDDNIRAILSDFYQYTLDMAASWIEIGREAGVISESIKVRDTADFFVSLGYGQMIKSLIEPQLEEKLSVGFYDFMFDVLKKDDM